MIDPRELELSGGRLIADGKPVDMVYRRVIVREALEKCPPELSADIMDKGMVLSGGSSLLRNIDQLLSRTTGVPAYVADEALFCVAKGTGIALENLSSYKRSILATN